MITLLLHLLRLLPFLCGGHRQLALENLALRQQLAVYKGTVSRPKLRMSDRLFWVWLTTVWAGWRESLLIVTPDTVLRWQRRRFREYWTKRSPRVGRPPINAEIAALVRAMAVTNPLWGAPRIHGELMKLGVEVAERTVSRLIPKRRTPPSQTWLTAYFAYYHRARTHLSLEKDAPDVRPVERPDAGRVVALPEVGGLHHRSSG